jgi:hypothetical protein
MAKCLRCGAGNEWLEGRIRDEPRAPPGSILKAARSYLDRLAAGQVPTRDKPTTEVWGLIVTMAHELEAAQDRPTTRAAGDT